MALVARHHDNAGSKARAFDVKLKAVTVRITNGCASHAARAFGPTAGHLVCFIGAKIASHIEFITVAGTAQLQGDFALAAAALTVICVATNLLGRAVFWP
ncbi:MAG: hypothetical protein WBG10_17785 [Pseudolabrys sp.]